MANIKDYDDIHDWAQDQIDENDDFIGIELDAKKMEKVEAIRNYCKNIVDMESAAQIVPLQFDAESRNALTQLSMPRIFFTADKRVLDALETMLDLSDGFAMTSDAGRTYMTFAVHEIWAKWKKKSDN